MSSRLLNFLYVIFVGICQANPRGQQAILAPEDTCECIVTGPFSAEAYLKDWENTCWKIQPVDCSGDPNCKEKGIQRHEEQTVCPAPELRYEYPVCGNDICQYTETCETCPLDCGFFNMNMACKVIINCPKYKGSLQKVVALTFDDGPSHNTPYLLDVLRDEGVPGSFFLLGSNILRYADTTRRIRKEGHGIASHSFSHPDLTAVNNNTVINEMIQTEEALQLVLGEDIFPTMFRPPYGSIDDRILDLTTQMGYHPVLWNLDPKDYLFYGNQAGPTVEYVRSQIRNNTGTASFIHLGHDLRRESIDLTRMLIKDMKTQNIKFVTIEDCLGIQGFVSQRNFTFSIPKKEIILTPNMVAGWESINPVFDSSKSERTKPLLKLIKLLKSQNADCMGMVVDESSPDVPYTIYEILPELLTSGQQIGLGSMPLGKHIEGSLKRFVGDSKQQWQEHYYILSEDCIVYEYKTKRETKIALATYTLKSVQPIDLPNKRFCFSIKTNSNNEHIFRTDTHKNYSDWYSAIVFNLNLAKMGSKIKKNILFHSFLWRLNLENNETVYEPFLLVLSEVDISLLRIQPLSSITPPQFPSHKFPISKITNVSLTAVKSILYNSNRAVIGLVLNSQTEWLHFSSDLNSLEFVQELQKVWSEKENSISQSRKSTSTNDSNSSLVQEIFEVVKSEGVSDSDLWRGTPSMLEIMNLLGYKLDQWITDTTGRKESFVIVFLFPGYPEFNLLAKKTFKIHHWWTCSQILEMICKKMNVSCPERYVLKTQDEQILKDDTRIGSYGFGLVFQHWCLKIDRRSGSMSLKSNEKSELVFMLPDSLARKIGFSSKKMWIDPNKTFENAMELLLDLLHIKEKNYAFQLRNGLTLSPALSIGTITRTQPGKLFLIESNNLERVSITLRKKKLIDNVKLRRVRLAFIRYANDIKNNATVTIKEELNSTECKSTSTEELQMIREGILLPLFDGIWNAMEKVIPSLFLREIAHKIAEKAFDKAMKLEEIMNRLHQLEMTELDKILDDLPAKIDAIEHSIIEKDIEIRNAEETCVILPPPPPPPPVFTGQDKYLNFKSEVHNDVISIMKIDENSLGNAIKRQKNLLRTNSISENKRKSESVTEQLKNLLRERFKSIQDESDPEDLDCDF